MQEWNEDFPEEEEMEYKDIDRLIDMLMWFGIGFIRRSLEVENADQYVSISVGDVSEQALPTDTPVGGIPGLRMDYRFSSEGKYIDCGIWDDDR